MSEYRRYSMECKEFRAMLDNAKQKVSDYDFYRTDEAKLEKALDKALDELLKGFK